MTADDFSTLLTVIAQCSATFGAIMGGLISSKAINDNAEESSLQEQLRCIDLELDIQNKKRDEAQEWINQDAASDFISDHFDELRTEATLEMVYDDTVDQKISSVDLEPYWHDAQIAIIDCIHARRVNQGDVNEDGIPITVAKSLNDFQKTVCRRNMDKIKDVLNRGKSRFPSVPTLLDPAASATYHALEIENWNRMINDRNAANQEIEKNEALRNLLVGRLKTVSNKTQAISGWWIFVWTSLASVILPLVIFCFSQWIAATFYGFWSVLVLALFVINIFFMSHFMVALLRNRARKKK